MTSYIKESEGCKKEVIFVTEDLQLRSFDLYKIEIV